MLVFLVTLIILVFVHEYGHFAVARACGVHVETFSVGFGKKLWRRRDSRGTEWCLSAIPLGGYVKFSEDENRPGAYERASVGQRAMIVLAGPMANFIFAVLVAWVAIGAERGFGHFITSFIPAFEFVWMLFSLMGEALLSIFTGGIEGVGGLIGIAEVSHRVEQADWQVFARFLVIMSINLGVVNLLPIPVLDGGQLTMLGVEAVRGRQMSKHHRAMFMGVGLCIIMLLVVIGTYNDIQRIFFA